MNYVGIINKYCLWRGIYVEANMATKEEKEIKSSWLSKKNVNK